jgi:hypothetical protein
MHRDTLSQVVHHVYVRRRPGCEAFLRAMARHYEIVVFTASLAKVCMCVCVYLCVCVCVCVCDLRGSLPWCSCF